jgi:hypothetical protein
MHTGTAVDTITGIMEVAVAGAGVGTAAEVVAEEMGVEVVGVEGAKAC